MLEAFLGQILLVPYNFAPAGWAFCNGQMMSIAQNSALFSLLGTTYGGDGVRTFALPDLRGRAPISSGQGPGLTSYDLGSAGGFENVTLNAQQLPAHSHIVNASTGGAQPSPAAAFPGSDGATSIYDLGTNATMAAGVIAPAGGSQPHENRPPYLVLNYIIALQGIFPSRN